ncbi:MAG: yobV [Paenibacillaceae bacterium]|jgi:predicted DNA-binding transcriptional regulator YafY|nr:yobV [Paenibacillaceae bacterium]
MRMDRLLNMVALLANRRQMKAQELAEHFGVSVRTIYRDADTISLAGFPIVSYPGAGGGLGVAEGFRLDRTVLSEEELSSVLLALHSTSGLWPGDTGSAALEKLKAVLAGACREEAGHARLLEGMDSLRFDYAPWSRPEGYAEELRLLRQGIEACRLVRFHYFSASGESAERLVEPYTLVMKSGQWYLYAYCLLRQDFRLFRLSRIRELELAEERFQRREAEPDSQPWNREWQPEGTQVEMKLQFPVRLRPLVEEWFGWGLVRLEPVAFAGAPGEGATALQPEVEERRKGDEPGRQAEELAVATVRMPEDNRLIGYLLSFGELVEVLEPEHIRRRLREAALAVAARYDGSSGEALE